MNELGYVEINLDRPRRLKLDMNAIAEAEDVIGKGVWEIFTRFAGAEASPNGLKEAFSFRELRALVWAGLLHELPGISIKETGNLIQGSVVNGNAAEALSHVSKKVFEALALFFGGQGSKEIIERALSESGTPNGTGESSAALPSAPSASSPMSSGVLPSTS